MDEQPLSGSWKPAEWPQSIELNDEPEGGWQSADPLYTTEILALTLCKFTGYRVDDPTDCPGRGVVHPNADCIMQYWSADAIVRGDVTTEMSSLTIRGDGITSAGVEPTFVEPA